MRHPNEAKGTVWDLGATIKPLERILVVSNNGLQRT